MYSVLATIATGEVRLRNFIQIKITCHCNHYASVQILSKQLSPASRREGLHPGGGLHPEGVCRGGLPTHPQVCLQGGLHPGGSA